MLYRKLGRLGWQVSEIGYGLFRANNSYNGNDSEIIDSLYTAIDLGCNFFDVAWTYGNGECEKILGRVCKSFSNKQLFIATKIPPKNLKWPSKSYFKLDEVFPENHIYKYTEKSLKNLKLDVIDILQFHVWEDSWSSDESWQKAIQKLKDSGKIKAVGISINRWEPNNVIETLKTGMIDTIQVSYNIFDQSPEDKLLPICKELNIGVIARCPFDEGALSGNLSENSTWPKGDFRNIYFCDENLIPSVKRADALKKIIPKKMNNLSELALRFILSNSIISTTIAGMGKTKHIYSNVSTSDGHTLSLNLLKKLKNFRWDRMPKDWSD